MCKLEKTINTVYITGGLILLMVVIMAMSSCASSNYYKGCDNKKKFRTEMN